ncbi:MAG: hypothetical protein V4638_08020 [Bacteroidota bacterium]
MILEQNFTEEQKFRQALLIALMIVINIGALTALIYHLFYEEGVSTDNFTRATIIFSGLMPLIITGLFFFLCRLKTTIDKEGIIVRFIPFHFKAKKYSWREIKKCNVREYSPIAEYGGWGIKGKLFKKDLAYNVSGKIGLQLEFTDGKKLLIGTLKPEELKAYLMQINQYVE